MGDARKKTHNESKTQLDSYSNSWNRRYKIGDKLYKGSILTSWWSTDHLLAPNVLYYDEVHRSGKATLNTVNCSDAESDELQVYIVDGGDNSVSDYVDHDSEQVLWGSVAECASGPQPLALESSEDRDRPPPTIILRGNAADKV